MEKRVDVKEEEKRQVEVEVEVEVEVGVELPERKRADKRGAGSRRLENR